MTADDSSIVTGWVTEVLFAFDGVVEAGRSSAPVAVSAANVPPEARTAARSAADTIVPMPLPDRPPAAGCWAGCCHDGAGTFARGRLRGRPASSRARTSARASRGWFGGAVQLADVHSLRGWGAGEKNELSMGWVSSSWGTFRSSVMNRISLEGSGGPARFGPCLGFWVDSLRHRRSGRGVPVGEESATFELIRWSFANGAGDRRRGQVPAARPRRRLGVERGARGRAASGRRLVGSRVARQQDGEPAADAEPAVDRDRAVVHVDDRADDREARGRCRCRAPRWPAEPR